MSDDDRFQLHIDGAKIVTEGCLEREKEIITKQAFEVINQLRMHTSPGGLNIEGKSIEFDTIRLKCHHGAVYEIELQAKLTESSLWKISNQHFDGSVVFEDFGCFQNEHSLRVRFEGVKIRFVLTVPPR